ncbi:branched-chain amino acid aminotransferase [Rhodobacteraceae bacterium RKSG542]|uniref:branched-chain amino acid aminotransferase n=1 Tax=Pseudovibrio flavus TaxID=2529854 RepID=UPI0012BBD8B1|nr:branched-chain amino acid aminotransferase [Pseudovibrio flavus]MTI18929.1 branched-chain amino acid aminotransferase [Pseudovibrio flavus]
MAGWSKTWTWFDGAWHEGNPMLMGPRDHAFWLGSSVFDGARGFQGVLPDIDLHAERVNNSALALGMEPTKQVGEIIELTKEGMGKFAADEAVYIRPMYWATKDGPGVIDADPTSTQFCLCMFEAPMAPEGASNTLTLSPFRRPTLETMPVNAKAGCLYPNNARASKEAKARGFDNAIVLDALGNVAELTSANVFMVKNGEVFTPFWNGTFLNGITRQRVIKLLRDAGYKVHEALLSYKDFLEADEIFSTGNYSKVVPVRQIDDRELGIGPVAQKARALYFEFSFAQPFTY